MYRSAYRPVFEELHRRLQRPGVFVGNTAGFPRVEVHSIVENQPTDKAASVRVISCVLESMSSKSMEQAARMNEYNLGVLQDFRYSGAFASDYSTDFQLTGDFRVVGVVWTGMNELAETTDTQAVIYRILQNIDIYVQQL